MAVVFAVVVIVDNGDGHWLVWLEIWVLKMSWFAVVDVNDVEDVEATASNSDESRRLTSLSTDAGGKVGEGEKRKGWWSIVEADETKDRWLVVATTSSWAGINGWFVAELLTDTYGGFTDDEDWAPFEIKEDSSYDRM